MHSFPYFFLWFGHRLLQAPKWGYSIPCFIDPGRDSCCGALSSLRPPLTVDLTGPARRRRGSRSCHSAWDPFFTLSFSSPPPYISLLSWQAILDFPVMLQSSFRDGGCVGGLVNISQVGKLPVRPECALSVTHMEERQEKVEVHFHVNSSSQGTSGVGHRKDKVRWSRHHFYILTAETFSFSLY